MSKNDLLKVGTITTTHGLKGEVKVYPSTDDVKRFDRLKEAVIIKDDKKIDVVAEKARYFKNLVILKFREFNDISEVEGLRQAGIYVTRENAVSLKEGEYFECDLIGLDVYDDKGRLLGILKEVIHTGANDVYTVKPEEGKEILIPAIKQCILDVDIENMKMAVHLLDGLI